MIDRLPVRLTVLVAAAAALLAGGCTVHRKLLITEVGLTAVEVHLAEPTGQVLGLRGVFLEYANSSGSAGRVELQGSIVGQDYYVVFEDPNHSGPPAPSSYTNYYGRFVDGLVVPSGFFGTLTLGQSLSYRVSGEHSRSVLFIPVTDEVDDVVQFGPQGVRPAIGGVFHEDGSLANDFPRAASSNQSQQRTVSRKFPSGAAQDTNAESDWSTEPDNFGAPTPP